MRGSGAKGRADPDVVPDIFLTMDRLNFRTLTVRRRQPPQPQHQRFIRHRGGANEWFLKSGDGSRSELAR
jgi:hypothetical protein